MAFKTLGIAQFARPFATSRILRFAYCFLYRRLVTFGLGHLFLNVVCSALCLGIGVESNVDTAIAVAVLCSHIQNVIVLGEDQAFLPNGL